MSGMRLVTIGGFRIYRRDKLPIRLTTRKAEALFAYLAITARPVRRDVIAALLWGDVPTPQARHSLRQTLTEIRAALRDDDASVLIAEDDFIEVDTRRILVDVHVVERLYGRTTERALRTAYSLCRGELLAGLDVKEAAFDQWLTPQRARIRQLSIEVHEQYVDYLLRRDEWARGIQAAIRLLALDPVSERAHRMLMTLYAKQGQLGAALRQYNLCAEILSRELNVEPSAETQQLRLELTAGRAAGTPAHGGRQR
jgi:DNA-binding SARP family transcriptional activator